MPPVEFCTKQNKPRVDSATPLGSVKVNFEAFVIRNNSPINLTASLSRSRNNPHHNTTVIDDTSSDCTDSNEDQDNDNAFIQRMNDLHNKNKDDDDLELDRVTDRNDAILEKSIHEMQKEVDDDEIKEHIYDDIREILGKEIAGDKTNKYKKYDGKISEKVSYILYHVFNTYQ